MSGCKYCKDKQDIIRLVDEHGAQKIVRIINGYFLNARNARDRKRRISKLERAMRA